MVGDATTDTGSARAAGVPCVVAGFGYNDVPLADLGGDIVIDRFSDLIAAVATLQQAATGTAAPAI
jgi:phosphoglycolate phosphatase